jgi:hypothetical protein
MSNTPRTMSKAAIRAAVARLVRLQDAGVPAMLDQTEAWHLTGGVIGNADGDAMPLVSLARIARDVPDVEAFLPDFRAYVAGVRFAEAMAANNRTVSANLARTRAALDAMTPAGLDTPDPGHCSGCGRTFAGSRGLRAHKASRYLAMGCRA